MPENQDPDDVDDDGSDGNQNIRQVRDHSKELRAQLRDQQARADKAEADLAAMGTQLAGFQKQQVFDRLHIPSSDAGLLFRETYTGELTDEAVMTAAARYNIVQPAATNGAPPPSIGVDSDAWARNQLALAGTTPTNQPSNAMEALLAAPNKDATLAYLESLGIVQQP